MFGWLIVARSSRLPLEPRQPIRIISEGRREDLEGNVAFQPRVTSAVNLAHPAFAERSHDFVQARDGYRLIAARKGGGIIGSGMRDAGGGTY